MTTAQISSGWDTSPKPVVSIEIPVLGTYSDPDVQVFHDTFWARMFAPSFQVTCLGPCLRSYTIQHNYHTGTCVYCQGQTSDPVVVGVTTDPGTDNRHEFVEASTLDSTQQIAARALWEQLHLYAVENQYEWNPEDADLFLIDWMNEVNTTFPPAACGCGSHLASYVSKHPPQTSTPKLFFLWGYLLHESVNDKLGKDSFLPADARTLYDTPNDWLDSLQSPRNLLDFSLDNDIRIEL